MIEFVVIHCPYCGESFETSVDVSAGAQAYVEDCAVCCRPIEVRVRIDDDGGLAGVSTASDRD
ncbi:MAG: CPXCG motif-containing cysteine-rich protein [Xanthomonadales bacterium]|nr:CPXCG motif-containing cysteine-rich protein [Xanthomonadales bacterium]